MKTLTPTLLASQKKPHRLPYVEAKVCGVTAVSIAKIDGVAVANIAKLLGTAV